MPTTYAHYRFGTEVVEKLPQSLQETIQRYREFYDIGLHGPDILFFYKPKKKFVVIVNGQNFAGLIRKKMIHVIKGNFLVGLVNRIRFCPFIKRKDMYEKNLKIRKIFVLLS